MGQFEFVILILVIWNGIWKGFAMWRSARQSQKWWFIAFAFIQSMGALEIIYLVFYSKKKVIVIEKKTLSFKEKLIKLAQMFHLKK